MKRKNILFCGIILIIIAAIVWGLFGGIHRRLNRSAISVQIDWQKPVVALTFDDGPHSEYTPQILDILYEQQVPATFFLVGENLSENKLLVQEMAASGHEIGSHTFSHPDLTTLDSYAIQNEIEQTKEALKKILPEYSMKFVRPPYGRYNAEVENAIQEPLMLWTIDSGDWETPHADSIYKTVVSNIQDRDIIVFHDDNAQTVEAIEKIIFDLKDRGFQFATVSQLYENQCR